MLLSGRKERVVLLVGSVDLLPVLSPHTTTHHRGIVPSRDWDVNIRGPLIRVRRVDLSEPSTSRHWDVGRHWSSTREGSI